MEVLRAHWIDSSGRKPNMLIDAHTRSRARARELRHWLVQFWWCPVAQARSILSSIFIVFHSWSSIHHGQEDRNWYRSWNHLQSPGKLLNSQHAELTWACLKIGYPGILRYTNSNGLSLVFPIEMAIWGFTVLHFRSPRCVPWEFETRNQINQAALVCGRTMEWRSLPTTRATELLHLMSLLQTQSDWLVMLPRIRWHAILRIRRLVWEWPVIWVIQHERCVWIIRAVDLH